MKITDLKAIVYPPGLILRVETDEGIYGIGEAFCPKDHVLGLKPLIVGQDPTNVERVMRLIRHKGGFKPWGAGVSGIEIALWDIAGKAAGLPVYKLLGGKIRDKVRVYCDCGTGLEEEEEPTYSVESYVKNAEQKIRLLEKFSILKFDIGFHGSQGGPLMGGPGRTYEADRTYPTRGHVTEKGLKFQLEIVRALKECLGEEVGLSLDCGPGQTLQSATVLAKALEPFNLVWAEDLLSGDMNPFVDAEAYLALSCATSTPTLTGEQIYLRQGFRDLVAKRAVDFISPDLCDCGGMMEAKWIAEFADLFGIQVAPHNYGQAIEFMANVHVGAAMPRNFVAFEFHWPDVSWWMDIIKGPEKPLIRDGHAVVPDTPGLGFELDEKNVVKRMPENEKFFE
jgi:L-alanine-DL-glutamate epimerase-like enolase superfamily enzyme